ncbi:MAG TPA: alkaline phosphatase family protein [Acidimicrobiales bacterium]|nr:alkaline phosphatase family protein [Acidimicrobiales bacterium]
MTSLPPATSHQRDRALDVLLSGSLEPIVDMVAWSTALDAYEVASANGAVRFRRERDSDARFVVEWVTGQSPVAVQDQTRFAGLDAERATPHPIRNLNSYPNAFEQFAQLFDHASAPDLCVIHSAAHNWADQGGHLGEHGSLGVVQARAPFIVAGAGAARLGMADIGCRLIDVAPTALQFLGAKGTVEGGAKVLSHQDGSVIEDLVDGHGQARHLIGFLWDGTNPNVLYDLAARGDAPNVARLIAEGTACRYGALASLPTVTLANHTTILTGSHPGHNGILHNAWIDRRTGAQVITNSPATWATSMQWLNVGVETMHHAAKRVRPGTTASINEPCDAGADYSTFGLVRNGERPSPSPPEDLPDATPRFVRPSKDYRWSSRADHTAVEQFTRVWRDDDQPVFTWVNFTLTDAAFHEGGPYSEMAASAVCDSDARLGRILEVVERSGLWDQCAFFLVADHGMQESDPAVQGDWDVALAEANVPVRDEGYGFLYLSEPRA